MSDDQEQQLPYDPDTAIRDALDRLLVAAADAGRYRGIAEAALKELATVNADLMELRKQCRKRLDQETWESLGVVS